MKVRDEDVDDDVGDDVEEELYEMIDQMQQKPPSNSSNDRKPVVEGTLEKFQTALEHVSMGRLHNRQKILKISK
jgi:hypothetical protein